MYEAVKDWIEGFLGSRYIYAQGQWVESEENYEKSFCVIASDGGQKPMVDVRRGNFRVILVGARGVREQSQSLYADASALIDAAISDDRVLPCGAANISSLGEPVGPGFTVEQRCWYQVNFEVIF